MALAVLAAVANAAASVLQRKSARELPDQDAFELRLLFDQVRHPAWLGGIAAMVAGFLLQAGALATGPIVLVQPILIVELAFTLLLGWAVFGTRLRRREWTAVIGMSGGIALLLVALSPTGGDPRHASTGVWLVASAVTMAAAGAFAVFGYRRHGAARAASLGVATGICFGFTAALTAMVTVSLSGGIGALFTTWQTYALAVVGPAGFFLLQNALQAGRLVASQPALTLANPLTALGWGVVVFGEQVRDSGWLAAELAGVLLIAACTVMLARSPLVGG